MGSDSLPPDSAAPAGGSGTSPDPDADLLRLARSGDTRAFGELVRRHQGPIYGLIARMVGDAATAEELAQDTFVRAWRSLAGFRGESRVSTWLFRIAVNLCLDHLGSRQARQRQQEISIETAGGSALELVLHQPGPDGQIEEAEVAAAFQEALGELDPDHRAAFLLRHQEGLSPAEIAAALEISPANAKVRVHRARQTILASLRQRGYSV